MNVRALTPEQMRSLDFGSFMDRVREELDRERRMDTIELSMGPAAALRARAQAVDQALFTLELAELHARCAPASIADLRTVLTNECAGLAAIAAWLACEGDAAFPASLCRPGTLAFPLAGEGG